MNNFRFENNKITIEFDNVDFDQKLEGKQLENIKQKIKHKQEELDNLKKLISETSNNEE